MIPPVSATALLASQHRIIWGLLALLMLGVVACGVVAALPLVLGPAGSYEDTLIVYAATSGGQMPVEWVVRLRVDGRLVEARCLSEAEALAIRAMMRR